MNISKAISFRIVVITVFLFLLYGVYQYSFSMAAQLDRYVQSLTDKGSFSGSVLVAKDGKILLAKGYGIANYEHMVPNAPYTKFHLGSITKQFASMAIMQLVQQGTLKLNDAVASLLPEYPINKAITVYNLLTMSSGLPEYLENFDTTKPTTLNKILTSIKYEPLNFTPGSKYQYCNTNYMLLRAIIEKLSQQDYETYLQMHIFKPLGMKDSGVLHAEPILVHRAQGYDLATGKLENAAYFDPSIFVGTGGLYSTVEDLYRWDRALYSDTLLAPEFLEQLWQPNLESYCLGWQRGMFQNHKYVWHSGDYRGCSTKIVRLLDDNICVIVLSNVSDDRNKQNYMASTVNSICNNMMAIVFGEKPHKAVSVDPIIYNEYVGQYVLEAGDKKVIFTITRDKDDLLFLPPGDNQKPFKIIPTSETDFFNDSETWLNLSFAKNSSGTVTELLFHEGDKKIAAKKIDTKSDWQRSVEKHFASKKSGQLLGTDKSGSSVIFDWHLTNVNEPEYVAMMHNVEDLFVQAFTPNGIRHIKAHPEIVMKADFFKPLVPFFKNGIENVDWASVEEHFPATVQLFWAERIQENLKQFVNSTVIFVIAKDAKTNEALGFVGYQIYDDDPQGTVHLEPLAVIPHAQNRGLGKLLTASIFNLLPTVTRITLSVESENELAVKAYQAWGFAEYEYTPPDNKDMEYLKSKSDILQKMAFMLKDK